MSKNNFKIRASAAGKLMTNNPDCGITDKQAETIQKLMHKKSNDAKGLTALQAKELERLVAKRDAPFELSTTAKTYVLEKWLQDKFDHFEPMVVKETLKGDLAEDDAIDVLNELIPVDDIRVTNVEHFEDAYMMGTPDLPLWNSGTVEDIKCPWSIKTFVQAEPDKDYEGQAQVYMHLTGLHKYRLCYVLVDTPDVVLHQEIKKFFYKFGADDENPDFQNIVSQLQLTHKIIDRVPIEQRLKVWSWEYDPAYIKELKRRVIHARKFYDTLELVAPEQRFDKHQG